MFSAFVYSLYDNTKIAKTVGVTAPNISHAWNDCVSIEFLILCVHRVQGRLSTVQCQVYGRKWPYMATPVRHGLVLHMHTNQMPFWNNATSCLRACVRACTRTHTHTQESCTNPIQLLPLLLASDGNGKWHAVYGRLIPTGLF